MTPRIVLFAGPICSGKSTLSKALAQKLGWRWVSFADYLRHVATDQRLSSSRSSLQDLGQQLIDKGWLAFCQSVLEFADWRPGLPLIVDGVRHVEAVLTLRSLTTPNPVTVVFVETPLQVRKERFAAREPGSSFEIAKAHPVEQEADARMKQLANHVVDGATPVAETVDQLVRIAPFD
jgi:cytidylate kinase